MQLGKNDASQWPVMKSFVYPYKFELAHQILMLMKLSKIKIQKKN